MNFQGPYILAMKERAPRMYLELARNPRAANRHFKAKVAEAERMKRELLARHQTPTMADVREAEELVRAALIEFPPENEPTPA